ncbi:MAG: hypothetical protein ABJB40_04920 [Acidobacteriota bacterium]
MRRALNAGFLLICIISLAAALLAQTKKPKKKVVTTEPTPAASPEATPQAPVAAPVKRNERPSATDAEKAKANSRIAAYRPVYFYDFERPGFTYSHILIEHDEAGKGKISFIRDGSDELLTDPIDLSDMTVTNIRQALTALNFLDSTENYQYSRDFSNLGNTTFTLKKDGRERTVKYNWTENKNAKILMDEYRRIGNEYTWKFEINIARENQPLQTPGLVDALDGYLQRSEISDPAHLLPFLEPLSIDERLPLMARNHATKLIKQIEKAKK